MGVEGGAGSREDVQEGMNGGGRVAHVQNYIYKFLGEKRKKNSMLITYVNQWPYMKLQCYSPWKPLWKLK